MIAPAPPRASQKENGLNLSSTFELCDLIPATDFQCVQANLSEAGLEQCPKTSKPKRRVYEEREHFPSVY